MMMSTPSGEEAPRVLFQGRALSADEVKREVEDRSNRIAGELDRVRVDCNLPYLADTVSLAAHDLHEHVVTALGNEVGGTNVIGHLLASYDALIRDLALVESSNTPDEGFPTNAQGRALTRFLRPHFKDGGHPAEWGARITRGGLGLSDDYLLVQFNDGYSGGIDRAGRTST
jgi:hypothetical protein